MTNNKSGLLVGVLLLLVASIAQGQHTAPPPVPGAGISNTKHDARTWRRSTEVCNICHVPHNATSEKPLWSHAMTTATFTLYGSPTIMASAGQPGQVSKLCLSCHDGTVAINNFIGNTGTATTGIGPANKAYIGTNLGNDHPIGFTYDTALATLNGHLADPATKIVTIGSAKFKTGSIAATMLVDGKVECTSCHDVHNILTAGDGRGLLKVSLAGSSLCLQCHVR